MNTTDAPRRPTARQRAREAAYFKRAQRAEAQYGVRLRAVARAIGELVRDLKPGDAVRAAEVVAALRQYAQILGPWARATGARMIAEIGRRDAQAWFRASRELGRDLRAEIMGAPMETVARELLAEQIRLITSLPTEVAERVHELALAHVTGGRRYDEIVQMLAKSGEVTKARATLIARTEVARTAARITEVRANYVGATHYVWHTAQDAFVRPAHRKLNGRVFSWDEPPVAEANGNRHHPGQYPNCFTGDTLVSLNRGIRRVFRSHYCGQLITLKVGDAIVRVTPNHPILTGRGWIAAEFIDYTDHVVQVLDEASVASESENIDQELISFDKLFKSLIPYGRTTLCMLDFYGDRVLDNQVEVVGFVQDLAFDGQIESFEGIGDYMVPQSDCGIADMRVMRCESEVLKACCARRRDSGFVGFSSLVFGDKDISFVMRPKNATSSDECTSHRISANAEFFTKRKSTFAAIVPRNNFLEAAIAKDCRLIFGYDSFAFNNTAYKTSSDVEFAAKSAYRGASEKKFVNFLPLSGRQIEWFDGHVYTLESQTGYYHVGLSLTTAKNCRCWAEPVIPDIIPASPRRTA